MMRKFTTKWGYRAVTFQPSITIFENDEQIFRRVFNPRNSYENFTGHEIDQINDLNILLIAQNKPILTQEEARHFIDQYKLPEEGSEIRDHE